MAKRTFKILQCKYRKIFKVRLVIFQHYYERVKVYHLLVGAKTYLYIRYRHLARS